MKTFAVVLVVMVCGRYALSDSSEEVYDNNGLACPPHDLLKGIHPRAIVAFLQCYNDLDGLQLIYEKFWSTAYVQTMSSEEIVGAKENLDNFNLLFDDLFKDKPSALEYVKERLLKLQNTMYPDHQLSQMSCDDKAAFTLEEEYF
ncbi:uncharacterized protein LOC126836742 [Adelges cooleyi]|uniref:uncharacterized protein LOC126836742 n=1 Tax=Adelges cooleyi TaxID=133065 RepID=UPI0021800257|nr:uncharacterized protein LOC126836742 [Adelges cooleyi]